MEENNLCLYKVLIFIEHEKHTLLADQALVSPHVFFLDKIDE